MRRVSYRDASSKVIGIAQKVYSIEPVDVKKSVAGRGIVLSYGGSSALVVDVAKFSQVAMGTSLMRNIIEKTPDMTIIIAKEKCEALLNHAAKKQIKISDFVFAYIEIRNALKMLVNKSRRYTFHLFPDVVKEDDGTEYKKCALVVQNPNLESVIVLSLDADVVGAKPVTIEELRDEYFEYITRKKGQNIADIYKVDEKDALDKWSDFGA